MGIPAPDEESRARSVAGSIEARQTGARAPPDWRIRVRRRLVWLRIQARRVSATQAVLGGAGALFLVGAAWLLIFGPGYFIGPWRPRATVQTMLDRSKRESAPIRRSFLANPERRPPLSAMVRHRDERALDLYLLSLAQASGGNFDVSYPA